MTPAETRASKCRTPAQLAQCIRLEFSSEFPSHSMDDAFEAVLASMISAALPSLRRSSKRAGRAALAAAEET